MTSQPPSYRVTSTVQLRTGSSRAPCLAKPGKATGGSGWEGIPGGWRRPGGRTDVPAAGRPGPRGGPPRQPGASGSGKRRRASTVPGAAPISEPRPLSRKRPPCSASKQTSRRTSQQLSPRASRAASGTHADGQLPPVGLKCVCNPSATTGGGSVPAGATAVFSTRVPGPAGAQGAILSAPFGGPGKRHQVSAPR